MARTKPQPSQHRTDAEIRTQQMAELRRHNDAATFVSLNRPVATSSSVTDGHSSRHTLGEAQASMLHAQMECVRRMATADRRARLRAMEDTQSNAFRLPSLAMEQLPENDFDYRRSRSATPQRLQADARTEVQADRPSSTSMPEPRPDDYDSDATVSDPNHPRSPSPPVQSQRPPQQQRPHLRVVYSEASRQRDRARDLKRLGYFTSWKDSSDG